MANERLSLCLGYGSWHGGGNSAAAVVGSRAGVCGIQLGKPHFSYRHDGGRSCHLPPDKAVVACFYRVTRLFGFWGSAKSTLPPEVRERLRAGLRDIISVRMAVQWQLVFFLLWMVVIMRRRNESVRRVIWMLDPSVGLYLASFHYLGKELTADGVGGVGIR